MSHFGEFCKIEIKNTAIRFLFTLVILRPLVEESDEEDLQKNCV